MYSCTIKSRTSKLVTGRYCILFFIAFFMTATTYAAMDPMFEIDTKTLGGSVSQTPKAVRQPAAKIPRIREKTGSRPLERGVTHVVKQGDNIHKILMRDYGLNNKEAELLVEDILSENKIQDIRRLKVGQRILIPPFRKAGFGKNKSAVAGQSLRLESPINPLGEAEASLKFRQAWERIIPSASNDTKSVSLQTPSFSLTLDPVKYPTFPTMDNARILLDADSAIPPLVRALIVEKDPAIRIVSESPVEGRRFLASMLAVAGFYSVEEDFTIERGTDPKLILRSDFKIEKTQDSLLNQDIVLINAGRVFLPTAISSYLKAEGFSVYEPFASLTSTAPVEKRPLYQLISSNQSGIIDGLLASLSIIPENAIKLDVFLGDSNGISLSVNAERYFEQLGSKTVVTRFDGDPVSYTLFRILETRGYQVVLLNSQDDFRGIAEKLFTRLNIKATYSRHSLETSLPQNFSLKMSGYRLEGNGLPAGGVFVTDLELDQMIRDILTEIGYNITVK